MEDMELLREVRMVSQMIAHHYEKARSNLNRPIPTRHLIAAERLEAKLRELKRQLGV